MQESTQFELRIPLNEFKRKACYWANQFPVFCALDSNQYQEDKYASYEFLLAVDALEHHKSDLNRNIQDLSNSIEKKSEWRFGFLGYDLKNEIEDLHSSNVSSIDFPASYFFEPRYLVTIQGAHITINRSYLEAFDILEKIENQAIPEFDTSTRIELESKTSKSAYLKNVDAIRSQIAEGDFYEMNYCIEFTAHGVSIDPLRVFQQLNQRSMAPMASLLKIDNIYSIGSSPERFLKKSDDQLISQPIKGTIGKGKSKAENQLLMAELSLDEKERAENVMIVDLVRNDLTKCAIPGTIKVPELFKVYEFGSINQMISTVQATVQKATTFGEIMKATFPMGSMTGAPKIEVMRNIEKYENFKRGIYSGAIGYIKPDGDFDLNVVIRSLQYDSSNNKLSLPVGGAITYDSIPEKEYAEILTKAQSIVEILQNKD